MSDFSPWYGPHHRRVEEALLAGANAASCSAYDRDGELVLDTLTNAEATGLVRFRRPGTATTHESCCSLGAIPLLAACGIEITGISSPNERALFWTGAALIDTRWRLPSPPAWVVRPPEAGIWLMTADDFRGLAALPLSAVEVQGRRFGDALAQVAGNTAIPEARARMKAARRALHEPSNQLTESYRTFVAEAAAEIFNSAAGLGGADGGLATLRWEIERRDVLGGQWHTVISSSPAGHDEGGPRRRDRLSDGILRVVEADAFGGGIHSARSNRAFVSLDEPVSESDDAPTLGSLLADADNIDARLELDDLFAAANLTERERDVLSLMRRDLTQAEIATELGITTSTVGVHASNIKKKLRRARALT